MKNINIALGFDNNYAQHAAVAICSVLENNTSQKKYHFYLFSPDLSKENHARLTRLIKSYEQKISFLEIKSSDFDEFNSIVQKKYQHHYKNIESLRQKPNITALFFKILFQDNLPADVDKILYLDSDVVALSDIGELFEKNLQDYIVGAVCEKISLNHLKEIGFQRNDSYFNSGILLLDISKWKKLSIGNVLINEAKSDNHLYSLHDQDVLNVHFKDNFLRLELKFNQMVYLFNSPPILSKIKLRYRKIQGLATEGILHYTGVKPWRYECLHPYKYFYFKYLEKTEFSDFELEVDHNKRRLAYINAFYPSRKIFKLFKNLR
jgi:lipopolysaccharide biosynthesis glycosyltransferase